MPNLLREGAAVLLGHALPHGLLDRLDLLPQGDARRRRGFHHLSVNGLLFSGLSGGEKTDVSRCDGGGGTVGGASAALTLASVALLTTWRERLVRSKPPKLQVLCGGGGWGGKRGEAKTHSQISRDDVKRGLVHTQRGDGSR